jgi:hypothetical protein
MLTGDISPLAWVTSHPDKTMPNVVSVLSREDHASLKLRAKANRRSLGAQLAFEAFSFLGLQAPAYIENPKTKKGARK